MRPYFLSLSKEYLIIAITAVLGVFAVVAYAEAAAYSAANVLGQASFTSGAAATTQTGMSLPGAVAYDSANKRLFVAEITNRRVLVFDLTTISDGEAAVNVLGQADFTSGASALAQNRLSNPSGLSYDTTNQRLYVADSVNNRVLMFDVASITNGENAALVLGQGNFTTATAATTVPKPLNLNDEISSFDAPLGAVFVLILARMLHPA